jgi:hypothetical protein
MTTLIIGCSFCSSLPWDHYTNKINWNLHPDIRVAAAPGSGNESIAARLLYECSIKKYDQVFVLWSGINRIDVSVSKNLKAVIGDCRFSIELGSTVWYHSGGISGLWTNDREQYPDVIRELIKNQYLEADSSYLSDRTFRSIITAQSFLSNQNISYKMAFAYDIYKRYFRQESFFGQADLTSPMYKLIDWNQIQTQNTLYEWAISDPTRMSDIIHPSRDAMREWILDNFKLDVAE